MYRPELPQTPHLDTNLHNEFQPGLGGRLAESDPLESLDDGLSMADLIPPSGHLEDRRTPQEREAARVLGSADLKALGALAAGSDPRIGELAAGDPKLKEWITTQASAMLETKLSTPEPATIKPEDARASLDSFFSPKEKDDKPNGQSHYTNQVVLTRRPTSRAEVPTYAPPRPRLSAPADNRPITPISHKHTGRVRQFATNLAINIASKLPASGRGKHAGAGRHERHS